MEATKLLKEQSPILLRRGDDSRGPINAIEHIAPMSLGDAGYPFVEGVIGVECCQLSMRSTIGVFERIAMSSSSSPR